MEKNITSIRPHNWFQALLHSFLTGGYMVTKWAISPLLYLVVKMGYNPQWPRDWDARINRRFLPLTEKPDEQLRQDILPAINQGDGAPPISVQFPGGLEKSLKDFIGSPLLILLIRGSWCSYSRLHLANFNKVAPLFATKEIKLLIVTSYADREWWQKQGIHLPIAYDPDGKLFDALGVRVESWLEEAWGRIIPHESVFLFDRNGRFITADIRTVSSIRPAQKFLSAEKCLAFITEPFFFEKKLE